MPTDAPAKLAPLVLVHGEEDLEVKQRARAIFQQWSEELGGLDHETIDATAGNADEALRAIGKLREALQTLPFFGGGKAVWFKDCNFLADDRTSSSSAVTSTLVELAQELKVFPWGSVRLVISAGRVDKRKTFFKTVEKSGQVELFAALSADNKDWVIRAEEIVLSRVREFGKDIQDEALAKLIAYVGPQSRQLLSEAEKAALHAGGRAEISTGDVDAVVTRNKSARAFALGDAVGDRNLPRVLKCLDEELWEMQFDKDKSEIGLLFGLISKVRTMLFAKEMGRQGWIKGEFGDRDYNRFKPQLERVPVDQLPGEKKFNPLAMNPYMLFRAYLHARNFTMGELVRAMERLLECNQRLVTTQLDEATVLQQALVQIVQRAGSPASAPNR